MHKPLLGRRYAFDQAEAENYEVIIGESNTVPGQGVNLGLLTQQRTLGQDINAILGVNQYDGSSNVDERVQDIQKLDTVERAQLLKEIKKRKSELEVQLQQQNEAKQKAEFDKLIEQKVKEKIAADQKPIEGQ